MLQITCAWKGCTSKFSRRFDMELHMCHMHMKYVKMRKRKNSNQQRKNGPDDGEKTIQNGTMATVSAVKKSKIEEIIQKIGKKDEENCPTPEERWIKNQNTNATTGISMPELADRWVKHLLEFGAPDLSVTSPDVVVCWMCRRTVRRTEFNPHIDTHELPEQELLEKVQLHTNQDFPSSDEIADALLNIAKKYGT